MHLLPANSRKLQQQTDSITKVDASPIQGDWYMCYNKMLEPQPDEDMKKSFYANLLSTSEGHTGEEKQGCKEITMHGRWAI